MSSSHSLQSFRKKVKNANFNILGYGFVPTYVKGEKGKYQLVVTGKRWKALRMKLKEITRKTSPMSFDERITKLNQLTRGWINYFKYASINQKLADIDGWLRNRLRYCIWTDWKKPEQGGALRKYPVDIFSERARLQGRQKPYPIRCSPRHGVRME
jgi:hypothetical protein